MDCLGISGKNGYPYNNYIFRAEDPIKKIRSKSCKYINFENSWAFDIKLLWITQFW